MIVPMPTNNANDNAIALTNIFPPITLPDGLLDHFFDRRNAVANFVKPRFAKGYHSEFNSFSPKLHGAGADYYKFAKLIRDLHHLVEANAAFKSGVIAGRAAAALVDLHCRRFVLAES